MVILYLPAYIQNWDEHAMCDEDTSHVIIISINQDKLITFNRVLLLFLYRHDLEALKLRNIPKNISSYLDRDMEFSENFGIFLSIIISGIQVVVVVCLNDGHVT